MSEHKGWLPGPGVGIHPDECVMRIGVFVCIRGDHPTATSDCTTRPGWRHETAEPATRPDGR